MERKLKSTNMRIKNSRKLEVDKDCINSIVTAARIIYSQTRFPQAPEYGAHLYDAVLLYANALNKTINQKKSIRDGKAIHDNLKRTLHKSKYYSLNGFHTSVYFSHSSYRTAQEVRTSSNKSFKSFQKS